MTRFPNPTRRSFSHCRPITITLSVRPTPPQLGSTATSSTWQSLDRADAISNLDFHPDCACKVTKLLLILSCEGDVLGRMLVRKEQFPMLPNFCHTIHGAVSSHKATELLRTVTNIVLPGKYSRADFAVRHRKKQHMIINNYVKIARTSALVLFALFAGHSARAADW